jgi:hypothetical protein
MRARLSMLTLSIALGIALGQTTPPNPPPQENTKPDTKTENTKPEAKTSAAAAAPASTTLAEMKTSTFKGVLVDMACASRTSSSAETKPASAETKASASDAGGSCPVSASSSELGMKLDDGKTVRFDLVGNQRAQDALKNDKRWSKDISANKPIHAKVSGVLNGDKLIVAAIH